MQIRHKASENEPWKKNQITNRAGKATGKNYSWWNITNQDGSKQAIDLNAINSWEICDSLSNSIPKLVDKNPETIDENMEQSNDKKTMVMFLSPSQRKENFFFFLSKTDRTGAVEIQTSIQGGREH